MGRTDVRALEVPEPLRMLPQQPQSEVQPRETPPAPQPPRQEKPLSSDVCPHCRARLSSMEAKLDRCLGCGKSISGAAAQLRVGI